MEGRRGGTARIQDGELAILRRRYLLLLLGGLFYEVYELKCSEEEDMTNFFHYRRLSGTLSDFRSGAIFTRDLPELSGGSVVSQSVTVADRTLFTCCLQVCTIFGLSFVL